MEVRKAMLVTLHHNGHQRVLMEIQGSDIKYIPGGQESSRSVVIRQARISVLKEELKEMGLIIDDVSTIQRVAEKFSKELTCKMGGKLAVDYNFGLGLCEIISE